MPIYEYKCKKCDGKFEMLRGMFDSDRDIKCPVCDEEYPERVFSVFGSKSSAADCLPKSFGST